MERMQLVLRLAPGIVQVSKMGLGGTVASRSSSFIDTKD
jgi:hypothetical protein